jgi:hypothetical protein
MIFTCELPLFSLLKLYVMYSLDLQCSLPPPLSLRAECQFWKCKNLYADSLTLCYLFRLAIYYSGNGERISWQNPRRLRKIVSGSNLQLITEIAKANLSAKILANNILSRKSAKISCYQNNFSHVADKFCILKRNLKKCHHFLIGAKIFAKIFAKMLNWFSLKCENEHFRIGPSYVVARFGWLVYWNGCAYIVLNSSKAGIKLILFADVVTYVILVLWPLMWLNMHRTNMLERFTVKTLPSAV